MEETAFEHEAPRIVVVDSSKVSRKLIENLIRKELPDADVISCETGSDALALCDTGIIDLVTTALSLPDMDGLKLSRKIRESSPQRYIPIIAVSGEVHDRLYRRDISDDVTDYFDKSHGFKALGAFVRGYVRPDTSITGSVLYVEDSKVVALATRRMMENNGLTVSHVVTVEEALEILHQEIAANGRPNCDLVLTDVYLKGGLTGKELMEEVRGKMALTRRKLPILVMTGDDNRNNQIALLQAGANDLVEKPIEERLLVNKLRFQLQLAKGLT